MENEIRARGWILFIGERIVAQFVARKIQTTRFTKLGQLVPLFPPSKIEKVSEEE